MIAHNIEESKRKKRKWPYFLAILLVIGIIFASGAIWLKSEIDKPNSENTQTRTFVIKSGQGGGDILAGLKDSGLLKNHFAMLFYLNYHRLGDKLLAGEYEIPMNLNIKQLAALLTKGQIISTKITIPEGWKKERVAAEYAKVTGQSAESFKTAAVKKNSYNKYWFLAEIGENDSLEGFLYPDTYQLKKKPSPDDLVVAMLDNFNKKISKSYQDEAKKQNLTLTELVTLASVVEREVAKPEDRKLVASVFLNRLEISMPLESCATVQYILNSNKTIFTIEETRTPSPYNTYLNGGLPPGPIGNPSIDSIKAVVFPTESGYLYFLSSDGKTYFSKTLDEHNQKKAIYLGG